MYWRCDMFPDCRDNEDEIGCTCKMWEYQCDNGRCIPEDRKCDNTDNCGDGSDEQNCPVIGKRRICLITLRKKVLSLSCMEPLMVVKRSHKGIPLW